MYSEIMMDPLLRNEPVIMACHFTGIYDVNRNTTLHADDYNIVKAWADSITTLQLKGILFHNNFSEATCKIYQSDYIQFIKVHHDASFSPNVYRYFIYHQFLQQQAHNISGFFVTDVADVVAVKNPFKDSLFVNNPATIFCGDEPKIVDDEWMKAHATHLRNNIADYAAYEETFKNSTLLNCGIIGGHTAVMQGFVEKLMLIHLKHNRHNPTAYTGDMGAFNYLIRTQYNQQLYHGQPVNTAFKGYETERSDCWFRHK